MPKTATLYPKTPMLPGIYWAGVVDWAVRIFHGYHTDEGSSYNSYFIDDECKTLIDSVKYPFADEWVARVSTMARLEDIKYIVVNHAEGDHTSALESKWRLFPNATFVTNKKCQEHLQLLYPDMVHAKWHIIDGKSELKIGVRTLTFVLTPLLHWPDSMFTYSAHDRTLFSMDGFGQHYASNRRWADECDVGHVMTLFNEYTANILGLFAAQMKLALAAASKLDIQNILTAHGVNWRGEALGRALEAYSRFSQNKHCENKVLVFFDSMYGATDRLAHAILEGVRNKGGTDCVLIDMKSSDITKVALHAFDASAVAIGSPTLNNGMMPSISAALTYIKGLALLKGKPVLAFGSYGWAERAVKDIAKVAEECKAVCVKEGGMSIKFQTNETSLKEAYEYGTLLAQKAEEHYKNQ